MFCEDCITTLTKCPLCNNVDVQFVSTKNTMIEYELSKIRIKCENIGCKMHFKLDSIEFLKSIVDKTKKIILVTGHRRENFGDGFINICNALKELSNNNEVQIIFPVHLNPNVKEPVYSILGNNDSIKLISPLAYPAFVWLMKQSYLIITDSGGIQEEAPSLGKPVLVMRDTTERPEAVEAGTVILVGTNQEKILNESNKLLIDKEYYRLMSGRHNPYGDGTSTKQIVDKLLKINE